MKKILLAGASGYLGKYLLNELSARGHYVRALVRDAGKLHGGSHGNLEVVEGEITQPESIIGCCTDIDVVISAIGITRQKDGLTYMDVDYQANLNLLEEARRSGVGKFLYISVLNGERLTHLGICQAKERFVKTLKHAGIDYCVIRPNGFFSDMAEFINMADRGRIYLFGRGQFRSNPIHGADLAIVCADAIKSTKKDIEVGGSETLTHNEIALIAFNAVKKVPAITYIPEWLRKITLQILRIFTKPTFYGPIEFFLEVMAMDMTAPKYGKKTLKEFFVQQSKQTAKLSESHTDKLP